MRYSQEAILEAESTRTRDQCIIGGKTKPLEFTPEELLDLDFVEKTVDEELLRVGYGCLNNENCTDCESGIKSFEDGGIRGVGCCESYQRHKAGMMTYAECREWFIKDVDLEYAQKVDESPGMMNPAAMQLLDDAREVAIADFPIGLENPQGRPWWEEGASCLYDAAGNDHSNKNNIFMRPCCGIRMNTENFCEILTESMCIAREGEWQNDVGNPKVLCSDVVCQTQVCALRSEVTSKTSLFDVTDADPYKYRNAPDNLNQWWRLIVPLFMHAGAIQLVLNMVVQYYCGSSIEAQAGFLRTFLIYFIAGIGGYLISGIFSPRSVAIGSDPVSPRMLFLLNSFLYLPIGRKRFARESTC